MREQADNPQPDDAPRRRWTDRLCDEGHLAFEVVIERVKQAEQAVAYEAKLREAAFESHKREHTLLHEAMQDYRRALDERLSNLNHLREEVMQDRALYTPREQFEARDTALDKAVSQLRELTGQCVTRDWMDIRSASTDARFRSIERTIWMGIGGVAVISGLVEIILHIVHAG
jgi:hypothetical protein